MGFDSCRLHAIDENAKTQESHVTFSGPCGLYLAEPDREPSLPPLDGVFPLHSCALASEAVRKALALVWEQSDEGPPCVPGVGMGRRGQRQLPLRTALVRWVTADSALGRRGARGLGFQAWRDGHTINSTKASRKYGFVVS